MGIKLAGDPEIRSKLESGLNPSALIKVLQVG
jgi:hypothetical protein